MLEAIRVWTHGDMSAVRFYQASSSEMFGRVQEVPQRETTLLWPRSPYGVSKVYGHYMTINYRESYGMHASSGILFNHESPRRGPEFVTRKVSLAVASIKLGLQDKLVMGNLDAKRDWGFAGDYVEAMRLMLAADEPVDLELGTGVGHTLRDLVEVAFAAAGVDDVWSRVSSSAAYLRPTDIAVSVADPGPAATAIGWTATVSFEKLVARMVEVDLERLRSGVDDAADYA
jgi:GDPmannose 4,6-dehydratase